MTKGIKVRAVFKNEMWHIYRMKGALVTTCCEYQQVCDYCSENNYLIVRSIGI